MVDDAFDGDDGRCMCTQIPDFWKDHRIVSIPRNKMLALIIKTEIYLVFLSRRSKESETTSG